MYWTLNGPVLDDRKAAFAGLAIIDYWPDDTWRLVDARFYDCAAGAHATQIGPKFGFLGSFAGTPVLFDPNLRLHRWAEQDQAVEQVRSSCEGVALVKVNREEAAVLTAERDPEAAAGALREAGAQTVVVTLGADGALARGAITAAVGGVPARPIDTTGAGDVVTGVLIAALGAADYAPEAIASALPAAIEVASRSTEGWGAIDSLPDPMPVFT